MDIYHYHSVTGEFVGPDIADPDLLNPGNYLPPAFATTISPPDALESYTRCFIDGAWQQIEDHRGITIYDVDTKEPIVITDLGPIPSGYTDLVPPGPYTKWDWGTGTWIPDQDALRELLKIAARNALIGSSIVILYFYEKALPIPLEWVTYRANLRDIMLGRTFPEDLPAQPANPDGY